MGYVQLFTVRMLAPAESLKACVTCLVDEETLERGKVTVLSFLLFLCSHCGWIVLLRFHEASNFNRDLSLNHSIINRRLSSSAKWIPRWPLKGILHPPKMEESEHSYHTGVAIKWYSEFPALVYCLASTYLDFEPKLLPLEICFAKPLCFWGNLLKWRENVVSVSISTKNMAHLWHGDEKTAAPS